ncbi:type V CRISPR-associated protein Cas12c [Stenotrophomonas maltophilia]|uniref:type V CRISPR-associated protein Cas12c n=1 Tax=Stenotrophomonas maltophilia TaxID=40324 RepID=UPI0039C3CA4D
MTKKRPEVLKRTALRKARQRIAGGSMPFGTRDLTAMRTRVLPLADEVGDPVWNIARDAALTLRGFGPGSISDVLLGMHAAGWRLFSSGSEREGFLLSAKFDQSSFDSAVTRDLGAALPKFTAANLRAVLAAIPRKVGLDTDASVLTERLARALGARSSQLDSPPEPIGALAQALAAAFPKWSQLTAVDGEVGKVIDETVTAQGYKWPSLQAGWSASLPVVPKEMGVPTVAFDPASTPIIESSASARFAGVVARYIPESGGLADSGVAKGVQSRVTTFNGSGLSWLFGVGRRALLTLPGDDIAAALDVSEGRPQQALSNLLARMRDLPDLSILGLRAYPDARAALQGAIDSLIANYINRLSELHATAEILAERPMVVPLGLLDPSNEWHADIFAGMPFTPDDVAQLAASRPDEVLRLQGALRVLAGEEQVAAGGYAAAIDQVEAFGRWASHTEAVAGQVNGRIRSLKAPTELRLRGVLDGGRWKSLVSISEPEGPPVEVLPQLDSQLQSILDEAGSVFDGLVSTYRPTIEAALVNARNEVRRGLTGKNTDPSMRPSDDALDLLARRKLLDHVARVTRRGSRPLAQAFLSACDAQGLTIAGSPTERSLRGHILSGEQVIYAHPLARRQSIVRLEHSGLRRMDLLGLLNQVGQDAASRADVREQVIVRFVRESLILMGLPERINLADLPWTRTEVPAGSPWANAKRLGPWVDLRASSDGTVARSEVIKAYTTRFHAVANGLLYRLNRVRFVERYDIRCFVGSTMLFVPQEGVWSPPEQYRHGKYAPWLSHPELPLTDTGAVDVRAAVKWLAKASANAAPDLRAAAVSLISQFPHSWVVACDFDGAEIYEGVFPSDGEISVWMKRRGYRLEPSRHFAGELLAGFKGASISPHGLTFERTMERVDDRVVETSRRVVAAVPIGTAITPDEKRWEPRHLMGLDLGEAGLGVCLRHLQTGEETKLLLPVRKTRLLARQQEHYRRKVQPRQSFRKDYSDSAELAIKAAIGEVCSIIDNLIVRYGAVPVFESSVAQARGSNKTVQRVFAGVLQRYTFVANNGAAQAVRQGHWFGAGRWQFAFGMDVLPAARTMSPKQLDRAKVDAVFRPALGFPGVMVSGYRTSLICSCCCEDALASLDAAVKQGQLSFSTDAEGRGSLSLEGRTITLQLEAPSPNPATQMAARRQRRRAPWELLAGRNWDMTKKADLSALAATIRRGLRRPSASIQGNKTSGWEFHCPVCGAMEQADVNAAVNLVRRYDERVRNAGAVAAQWEDPEVRAGFIASMVKKGDHQDEEAQAA